MPLISQFSIIEEVSLFVDGSLTGTGTAVTNASYITPDYTTFYKANIGPATGLTALPSTFPPSGNPPFAFFDLAQKIFSFSKDGQPEPVENLIVTINTPITTDTYVAGIQTDRVPTFDAGPLQVYVIFTVEPGANLFVGNTAAGYTVDPLATNIQLANNATPISVLNVSGSDNAYLIFGFGSNTNGALSQTGIQIQTVS